MLKEKIRRQQFLTAKQKVEQKMEKITCDDCNKMIVEILKRLDEVIKMVTNKRMRVK
jgi:hypothetical protein